MKALKLKTLALVALLLLAPLHAFAETAEEAFAKGKVAYEQKQYPEAIKYYTKTIELNPQLGKAYGNRGNVKSDLGDNAGAIEDYNKLIQLDPKSAIAYNNRGIAKAQLLDKTGAFADVEKAKQLYVEQGDVESYKDAIKAKNMVSELFALQGK
jgi:tetratricopeptide (TPR) repeat protein